MLLSHTTDPSRTTRHVCQAGDLVLFTCGLLGMIRAVLPPTRHDQEVVYFVLAADQTERLAKRGEIAPMPANLNDYDKPAGWRVANFLPDHFAKIQ